MCDVKLSIIHFIKSCSGTYSHTVFTGIYSHTTQAQNVAPQAARVIRVGRTGYCRTRQIRTVQNCNMICGGDGGGYNAGPGPGLGLSVSHPDKLTITAIIHIISCLHTVTIYVCITPWAFLRIIII